MTLPAGGTSEIEAYITVDAQTIAFPSYFLLETDLEVTRTDQATTPVTTLLVIGSDYDVSGAGNELGGSITLKAGVADVGDQIVIKRQPPCSQLVKFDYNKRFASRTNEKAHDKAMMLICLLIEQFYGGNARVIRYPDNEFGTNSILPEKESRKGGILVFDETTGEIIAAAKGSLDLALMLLTDPTLGGATPSNVNGATQAAIKAYIDSEVDDLQEQLEVPAIQFGHGFTQAGVAVRLDNSFNFVLAQADTEANAQSVGLISEVIDANNFRVKFGGGEVTVTGHGFSEGPVFLDPTTPGALTQTKPDIIKQVAYVKDANTLIVVDTYPIVPDDIKGLNETELLITGSQVWAVPAGVKRIKVTAVAGGGGGGGSSSNGGAPFGGNSGTGSSGGGGETRVGYFDVTPGANITVTIGAGGAGGAGNAAGAGSPGSAGGNTVLSGPISLTANGGGGGGATTGGGSGGSGGSGGLYGIGGQSGQSGFVGALPTLPGVSSTDSAMAPYGIGGRGAPGGGFFGWNGSGGTGGNGAVLIEW